ncbi:hypothetical protein DOM21_03900 [Bacteriovorax stolpii]|uniref:Glycosyltransferase subfamily 4-like N-terminal domain-containing protein n=1 Tax=Bacteriovorax stolpii TaxID=960 RepID=A0A2K9NV63_BACTC|nr:glycosyltransferase [Bacteriovorax stolpii]AUN99411.1 hypothetical protein C0V70_15110 [Bacteriovorax stolpii]QDK40610.1 hypothetical protein DOM21_03900 [Bacteriovorax stolpii]TDP55046.1 glycosyl transferase family 4 [Bacteriovorax stolpii]
MKNKYSRNILYVLPSKAWNTKERFAFRDIIQAKGHGYNVYLYTYEDSFAAKVAKHLEIEIIPYKPHFINRFLRFHKHLALGQAFKKSHIDIVHCYDFTLLCSLSFQLKRQNITALVVTQDHSIDKPLQRFWYRPLISRIDSLILANKNLLQDALGNLGLPLKKIEYFGLGIKYEEAINPLQIAVNFELYKDYFLAGTYVSPGLNDHKHITPILAALKVINQKEPGGKRSKLVLISPVDFQSMSLLPNLMRDIQEQDLQEDVLFVTTQDIVGVISRLDLWVSNSPEELIEDHAISALIHEVPAVLTRNFCSKDLIEEYEGVGETYKLFDARELRDKWEKMILGRAVYREKTRLYKYFIEREHSYKSYKSQLMSLYSKSVQRRVRLFRKK